jgi:hypothetical protein
VLGTKTSLSHPAAIMSRIYNKELA